MSYHPKDVADFGTAHGFDLTSDAERAELAQEYVKAGKAPAGMAAATIVDHLEHFVKGQRVGLYEPDGTTRVVEWEWEVQGNYGQGWEMLTTEGNPLAARERLAEYDENEPQYPHRIKRVRTEE